MIFQLVYSSLETVHMHDQLANLKLTKFLFLDKQHVHLFKKSNAQQTKIIHIPDKSLVLLIFASATYKLCFPQGIIS